MNNKKNYVENIKKLLVNNQALRMENPEMSNSEFAKLINRSPQSANSVRVALKKNLDKLGYTPEFVEEANKNPGWFFIDLPDLTVEEIKEVINRPFRRKKLCDLTIEDYISEFRNWAPKEAHPILKKIGMYSTEYHNRVQRILMMSEYPMNFIRDTAGLREGDSYTSIEEAYHVFNGMIAKLDERRIEIIEETYKYHVPSWELAKKYNVSQGRILQLLASARRKSHTRDFLRLVNALNDDNRHGYVNFNDVVREIERRKEEEENKRLSELKTSNISEDTLLEELGLSVRALNCLKRAGMNNFGDIVESFLPSIKGEEEAPQIRNFGVKCYTEVKDLIEANFKEEEETE